MYSRKHKDTNLSGKLPGGLNHRLTTLQRRPRHRLFTYDVAGSSFILPIIVWPYRLVTR